MVGGRIIEITPMSIVAGDYPGQKMDVVRLWVIDTKYYNELAVFAVPGSVMPKLGDEIWWQCGWIYFNKDKNKLKKIAYSFDPRNTARV
jgi:hypothetical protein